MEASLSTIENILAVMQQWEVPRIILGGGEPLLHPDILDVLAIFKYHNFKPVIATNGILLEDAVLDAALATCMNIQISLDTLDRAKYIALRGIDAVEAVKSHIQELARAGILVRVVTVLNKLNIDELEHIGCFLASCGIKQWFIFEMLKAGRGASSYDALHVKNDGKIRNLAESIEQNNEEMSVWYWGNKSSDGCAMYVLSNGSLAITDYHSNRTEVLSGADVDIDSVRRIWSGIDTYAKINMLNNFLSANRLAE